MTANAAILVGGSLLRNAADGLPAPPSQLWWGAAPRSNRQTQIIGLPYQNVTGNAAHAVPCAGCTAQVRGRVTLEENRSQEGVPRGRPGHEAFGNTTGARVVYTGCEKRRDMEQWACKPPRAAAPGPRGAGWRGVGREHKKNQAGGWVGPRHAQRAPDPMNSSQRALGTAPAAAGTAAISQRGGFVFNQRCSRRCR